MEIVLHMYVLELIEKVCTCLDINRTYVITTTVLYLYIYTGNKNNCNTVTYLLNIHKVELYNW